MVNKYVKKMSGKVEPFEISKIKLQTEFATKGSKISSIEYESLIQLPKKETITSEEIQFNIINSGVKKITIDTPEWDGVVGRANMYNLYRHIFKRTKYDLVEWEEMIRYLVRNNYYRKDVLKFLDNISNKDKRFINSYIKNNDKNYDWKMTYAQVEILKSKYLIKNKRGIIEYPIVSDIVNALIISRGDKHFQNIFDMIHNQYISLATPFKRNLRRPDGNVGSCFIGENIDSLSGIGKSWMDMGFISKEGGGIGWYLGKVRPEDTWSYKIVKANNITKWVKIINDIAIAINQAGARPGAITLALDWWHLDIESFLEIKSELNGDLRDKAFDIFPQVVFDKWFMEKKQNNEDVYLVNQYEYKKEFGIDITELTDEALYDVHKHIEELVKAGKWQHYRKINSKDLWSKSLWTWVEIGDMYLANKDGLNKSNYLKYDPDGGIAKCGNLCLIGDTNIDIKIKDKEMTIKLEDLEDYMKKDVIYIKSYNIKTQKDEWKECYEFLEMGESEEIYEIETTSGKIIECTGDHKIFTQNRGYVLAKDLEETDILLEK